MPVIVGAIGATYTQIVRGLTPGTRVVLANLSEKVPSASSSKPQGFIGTRIQIFHGKGGGQSVVVEGGRAGF
ncbi:MAG: hypothetical protein ACRDQJ_18595 [Pseudonocardiaceae bacterium]